MEPMQRDEMGLDLEKLKTQIQEEGSVTCPRTGCEEVFKSIWGLRYHLKKNACKSDKCHECHKCNKVFSSRIILQQHLINCDFEAGDGIAREKQGIHSPSDQGGLKRVSEISKEHVTPEKKKRKIPEKIGEDSGILRGNKAAKVSDISKEAVDTNENKELKASEKFGKDAAILERDETANASETLITNISSKDDELTSSNRHACKGKTNDVQHEMNVSDTHTKVIDKSNSQGRIPVNNIEALHYEPSDSDAKTKSIDLSNNHTTPVAKLSTVQQQENNSDIQTKSKSKTSQTYDIPIVDSTSTDQLKNNTPKRKRGRPRKMDLKTGIQTPSMAQQASKSNPTGTTGTLHTSTPNDTPMKLEQDLKGKLSKQRKKSINPVLGTPQTIENTLPNRRSSRSTLKKVNYAQLDSEEEDEYDDDDIHDDDHFPSNDPSQNEASGKNVAASAVKRVRKQERKGKPKKIPKLDFDQKQTEGDKIDDENCVKKRRGHSKKVAQLDIDEKQNKADKTSDENSDTVQHRTSCEVTLVQNDNQEIASEDYESSLIDNKDNNEDDRDTSINSSIDLTLSETNLIKTPKKRGRPRKNPFASQTQTAKITSKPKKIQKVKTEEELKEEALKMRAKKGLKISCTNHCGKKFTTYLGYKAHMKVCGKNKEERGVLSCELCDKEYTTKEGLRYHFKTVHEEKKEEDTSEIDNIVNNEPDSDVGENTPRQMRQAAVRAIEKVKELKKDLPAVSVNKVKAEYRSKFLDTYIKKLREGVVTPALINIWKEEIDKNGFISCPNKDCSEEFKSSFVLQTHFLKCGFEDFPFQCNVCDKDFLTISGARNHVDNFHLNENKNSEEVEDNDDFEVTFENYQLSESEEDFDHEDNEVFEALNITRSAKKRSRTSSTKFIDITIGTHNKKFKEYEKWRNNNFAQDLYFSEHVPMLQQWCRVETCNIQDFIPTSPSSPYFLISRPQSTHQNADDVQLPLFTSLPKDESEKYGDRIFYTGGPVWGLSWCPTPDTETNVDQYIAVSTHRNYQTVHNANNCTKENGVLQIWNTGTLSNYSSRSGDSPTLALCIAHNFGPIWKMSWCPTGTWQCPDLFLDESELKKNTISRLGLLAVACGDGIVHILSIPHPNELLSKLPLNSNEETDEKHSNPFNKVMVHGTSVMDLYPCSVNCNYDQQRGMAVCVDWSQTKPFHRVAAGFSDGSVAVWNLASKSPLLRKSSEGNQKTLRMAPFVLFKADSASLRDLAWCPSHQDIIVTSGHEKTYKIWDLKSSLSPLILQRKSYICELEWPLHFNGFLFGEQEFKDVDQPSLRYYNLAGSERVRVVCHHGCSLLSLSFNNWIQVVASSNIAGDIFLSKINQKTRMDNKWFLYNVHLEDRNVGKDSRITSGSSAGLEAGIDTESRFATTSIVERTDIEIDGPQQTNTDSLDGKNNSTSIDVTGVESAEADNNSKAEGSNAESKDTQSNCTEISGDTNVEQQKEELRKQKCPTLYEAISSSRLVFQDTNLLQFKTMLSMQKKDCPTTYRYNSSTLLSIQKVRWNPNKQGLTWIASGGVSGLVRIHQVKQMNSNNYPKPNI